MVIYVLKRLVGNAILMNANSPLLVKNTNRLNVVKRLADLSLGFSTCVVIHSCLELCPLSLHGALILKFFSIFTGNARILVEVGCDFLVGVFELE